LREAQSIFNANYTDLLTSWPDKSNLRNTDAVVDAWVCDCYSYDVTRRPRSWVETLERTETKKFPSFTRPPKESVNAGGK